MWVSLNFLKENKHLSLIIIGSIGESICLQLPTPWEISSILVKTQLLLFETMQLGNSIHVQSWMHEGADGEPLYSRTNLLKHSAADLRFFTEISLYSTQSVLAVWGNSKAHKSDSQRCLGQRRQLKTKPPFDGKRFHLWSGGAMTATPEQIRPSGEVTERRSRYPLDTSHVDSKMNIFISGEQSFSLKEIHLSNCWSLERTDHALQHLIINNLPHTRVKGEGRC